MSFDTQESNLARARAPMTLPSTVPMPWPVFAIGYLIPWFNGGCPRDREWLAVTDPALNLAWVGLWAIDPLCSFGWPTRHWRETLPAATDHPPTCVGANYRERVANYIPLSKPPS